MNQDLTGNQYPPPGFQSEGSVVINPSGDGEGTPIVIDSAPTEGSSNAVSSGGVFTALEGKENKIVAVENNASDYVFVGNKTFQHLPTLVESIVDGLELGGGTGGVEIPDEYLTEDELEVILGDDITAPLNLTPVSAAVYEELSYTFSISVFAGGAVSLISAPAGAVVTIGNTNVVITWVPIFKGDHYVVFWVGNGKKLGRPASLKITVQPAETVVPIGDTVLIASSISAGMLVNIYNDGGTPKIRPALATEVGRRAVAFVTQNGASGQTIVPKFSGNVNPYFTGLIPGTLYFLSWTQPGKISPFGPDANSGYVWQPVGVAISTTELLLDINLHYLRTIGS